MYKKRLSKKIAQVFEIVGYFQLIPAVPIVVFSAILIFPLLVSVPVFGTALILFGGYIKHSRGTLSEGKIIPLWIGTFLFNFLPLLFPAMQYFYDPKDLYDSLNRIYLLLIFWWMIACCLSLTAIYDELAYRKK